MTPASPTPPEKVPLFAVFLGKFDGVRMMSAAVGEAEQLQTWDISKSDLSHK